MFVSALPLDGAGICGEIFQLSFLGALALSTLLLFIYLWRKKRLDWGEDVKYQLFEEE